MKSKLIIGDSNSIFVRELINKLKDYYPEARIDCLSTSKNKIEIDGVDVLYQTKITNKCGIYIGPFKWILWFFEILWWFYFRESRVKYDVVQIHYVSVAHLLPLFIYKKVGSRVVSALWGSDVLRCKHKKILRIILMHTDIINCTSEKLFNEVVNLLGERSFQNVKITRNLFGLAPLDAIKGLMCDSKRFSSLIKKMKLDTDKKIVTCGYNAMEAQQHLNIIESLELHSFSDVLFVFPMTYGGSDEYKERVKERLSLSKLDYIVLEDFLSIEEVSALRMVTDVFFHLQKTDAFSGSMQEHLYSKNLVITGAWLEYKDLKKLNVRFLEVNDVIDIGDVLFSELMTSTVSEVEKLENQKMIYELSAWENVIEGWDSL